MSRALSSAAHRQLCLGTQLLACAAGLMTAELETRTLINAAIVVSVKQVEQVLDGLVVDVACTSQSC